MSPPRDEISNTNTLVDLRGLFDSLKSTSVVFFGVGDLGGGDSVRTRNALHEVGARSQESERHRG